MTTILSLAAHRAARRRRTVHPRPDHPIVDDDRFLIEEGLDLLAAYRSIADRRLRLQLKTLVESVASHTAAWPATSSADDVDGA